jgi:hypothetical protein
MLIHILIGLKAPEFGIDRFDPIQRRLRCNGHVINLAAQALLFPELDYEALLSNNFDDSDEYNLTLSAAEMQNWRKKGPLGKLHNIAVYIARSPQRIEKFKSYSKGRILPRDNSTRWNSWFRMLDVALKEDIKLAIAVYCIGEKDLAADLLSESDWEVLCYFHGILQNFEEATLGTEGYKDTVDQVLTSMEFLLEELESARVQFRDHMVIGPCVEAAWNKVNKYYTLTERSVAYTAAMVLVPS